MDVFEALLPSGRAVRVKRLSTRDKLAIEDRVEKATKGEGSNTRSMTETAMTCLVAYTEPLAVVMNGDEADVDATLNQVKEAAWYKTSYLELLTSGPKSLLEVFDDYVDFKALLSVIGGVSGKGMNKIDPLAAKVRTVSM